MRKLMSVLLVIALLCAPALADRSSIHWNDDFLAKYRNDPEVNQLIGVQGTIGAEARVLMYEKSYVNDIPVWTETLNCEAYIGRNGLTAFKAEGDGMTPIGDFGILTAFGIKENPGTKLPYIPVTEDLYCCGDETAYNQIISIDEYPHDCANGEQLIYYSPEYNYAFFLDYNSECEMGKGSAIFFHVRGPKPYTGGCVAVSEEDMLKIITTIEPTARVIINYMPNGH